MLSSDAISSVAYGPEQITTVLVTLSAAAIWYSIPIAAVVLVLLLAITLSYQQIIHAYPSGWWCLCRCHTELGSNGGLFAGGSLLVDYMLTVAVSTTSELKRLLRQFLLYINFQFQSGSLLSC